MNSMRNIIPFLCLLLSPLVLRAQDGPSVEKSSPVKMGKPTWTIKAFGPTSFRAREIELVKTPARKGSLDDTGPYPAEIIKWSIARTSIEDVSIFLPKFAEWCQVSRKNKVTDFQKELGKSQTPLGLTALFTVTKGVPELKIQKPYETSAPPLSEFDALTISGLLKELPAMDKALGNAMKPSPKDELFK